MKSDAVWIPPTRHRIRPETVLDLIHKLEQKKLDQPGAYWFGWQAALKMLAEEVRKL